MSTFQSARPRSKLPIVLVLILLVIASIAGGAYFFQPRFEAVPPQITIAPNVDIFGVTPLEIQVTDQGAGLKSVTATLSQGGTEHQLASEQFDRPVSEKKIAVALAKAPGVKEGAAVLRVIARDASLWHFFSGNEAMLEKSVTIDITPPTLELIADDRYVNFGGVGVIVYKASADTATSGVKIGDYFFPGLRRAGEGPPGALFGALRASLQRPAGREAHGGCHRQGRQRARATGCLRAQERPVQEEHPRDIGRLSAEQGRAAARRRHRAARARQRTCSWR
jgi:hypothetical protein